jgi:hypothetical protein
MMAAASNLSSKHALLQLLQTKENVQNVPWVVDDKKQKKSQDSGREPTKNDNQ